MIYITGDTHGNVDWNKVINFARSGKCTKNDIIIIAGDFGAIWDGSTECLSVYERLLPTICFVDGNHENFAKLEQYPYEDNWNGGRVQKINSNVVHLL